MSEIKVELQEHMGSDSSIANAAWTSTYDKSNRDIKYDDPDKVAKLVPRLIKENHGTPIESVVFRFWIKMPIYIDRQHTTHRIASHNGLSQRYRTAPTDWYAIPTDCKDILDKIETDGGIIHTDIYNSICSKSYGQYSEWISKLKDKEIAGVITNAEFKRLREVLRGVLPLSGMTERTTIMNLRSFANYMRLRLDSHAQPEIQEVARQMLAEVKKANVCPIAIKTLEEINWRI